MNYKIPEGPAKARYQKLRAARDPYLERAKAASRYSVPHLIPDDADTNTDTSREAVTHLFSSLGGTAVSSLASKIMLALFPPTTPFVKFGIPRHVRDQLKAQAQQAGGEITDADITDRLAIRENEVKKAFDAKNMRPALSNVIQHLLVAGNVVLRYNKNDSEQPLRAWPISRFVARRSPNGSLKELVLLENVCLDDLPEATQQELNKTADQAKADPRRDVAVYTHCVMRGKKWEVYQEAESVRVEGSEGNFTPSDFPYLALTLFDVDGESYSRSMVELYYGHLYSINELTKSIVESSGAAAKLLFGIEPGSGIKPADLANKPNGGFFTGRNGQVWPLQVNKLAEMRTAQETIAEQTRAVQTGFLMNQSVQRDAERVTAEEVRYMIQELESAHAGMYAMLATAMQMPIAKWIVKELEANKSLAKLPKEYEEITVVGGLDALGRGTELSKLQTLVNLVAQSLGPEAASMYLDPSGFILKVASSLGVEANGLIRSQEEVQQMQQQSQMQQMVETLGPNAINAMAQQQPQQGTE